MHIVIGTPLSLIMAFICYPKLQIKIEDRIISVYSKMQRVKISFLWIVISGTRLVANGMIMIVWEQCSQHIIL
jgi:hypothetical protein